MRPLYLEMTAFGPYCEKVELDFAKLASNSLFLIAGPTGGGKTTILDAMVFALFGQTSGGKRDGASMRSDYAESNTPTLVKFTFAVGLKRYCLERSPKQKVLRKDGKGLKEQAAMACLYEEKEGDWQEITSSSQEIKEKVQEIIGFRVEQFLQVVLLPQGEFRKLLMALTSEREVLLHNLFKTEIYKRLQDVLKEEYEAEQNKVKSILDQQQYILISEQVDSLASLEEKIKTKQTVLESAQKEWHIQNQYLEYWSEIYRVEEERLRLEAESMKKKDLLAHLVTQEEEMKLLGERTKLLRTTEPLFLQAMQGKELELESQQLKEWMAELEALAVSLADNEKKLAEAEKEIEREKASQEERLTKWKTLDIYKVEIEESKQWATRETTLRTAVEEALEKRDTAQQIWQQRVERIDALKKERQDIEAWLLAHEDITEQRQAVLREQENIQNLSDLIGVMEDVVQKKTILSATWQDLQAEVVRQEKVTHAFQVAWENSRAYQLAKNLAEGEPCSVCGSLHHPRLAEAPDLEISKDEVDRAIEEVELAKRNREEARLNLERVETSLTVYEKQRQSLLSTMKDSSLLGLDWFDVCLADSCTGGIVVKAQREIDALLVDLNALIEEEKAYKQTLQTIAKQGETYGLLEGEERNAYEEALRAVEKAEMVQRDWLKQCTQIDEKLTTLVGADWRDSLASLEKEIAAYEQTHHALAEQRKQQDIEWQANQGKLSSARDQLASLEEKQKAKEMTLLGELQKLGLSLVDWDALNDERSQVELYEGEVKTYNQSYHTALAQVQEADRILGKHKEDSRVQVAKLATALGLMESEQPITITREAVESQKNHCQQLSTELGVLQETIARSEKSRNEWLRLQNNDAVQREKVDFVFRLHELANGGSSGLKGVTFERFVLGSILEEVIMAANIRLREMSRGRYELQRTEVDGSGRGHRGLDLTIFDSYTGYARSANTLSGGETFLASLALALGLADIVQAYAGGIHLDTMFIDEGFGTLDPDTLDVALESLVALQQSGRLIGVISHVPELKQRIPVHLTVQKVERGSRAFFEHV